MNFLTEYQKNMGYRYNQPMLRENPPFACGINPLYIVSLIGLSPFFMGSLSWRYPFRPLFIRHRAITMGRIALIANPLNL